MLMMMNNDKILFYVLIILILLLLIVNFAALIKIISMNKKHYNDTLFTNSKNKYIENYSFKIIISHIDLLIDNYKIYILDNLIQKLVKLHNLDKSSEVNSIKKFKKERDKILANAAKDLINNYFPERLLTRIYNDFFTESSFIVYILNKLRIKSPLGY
jgi:hypothetical protein